MPIASPTSEEGHIGKVRFEYDARLLSLSDVQIAIPAGGKSETFGVKLVPTREVGDFKDAHCAPATEKGQPCSLEQEPGLTLAILERTYDSYAKEMRSTRLGTRMVPTEIDGTKGVTVDAGTEDGMSVDYTLVPVDSRALLIKRQSDGETAQEEAAIAKVVASLDLP